MASFSVTECRGAHVADGCGGEFPMKTAAGLCGRCHLLDESETPDENKRKEMEVCKLPVILNQKQ
jgi:hypothetical protein